jgi:hypothetical protein
MERENLAGFGQLSRPSPPEFDVGQRFLTINPPELRGTRSDWRLGVNKLAG